MVQNFSEIVIKGPFFLVKGFLTGYSFGSDKIINYFFHRKSGIRRETLKDFIKEYFEFENYVHLCIEDDALSKFISAIKKSHDKIGLSVESVKSIKSAGFSFSYEVFNEKMDKEINSLFEKSKKDVKIIDFNPRKQKSVDAEGIEAYAPIHAYISTGDGKVEGPFYHVMNLFLSIKRSKAADLISCSDIILQFKE